MSCGDGDPILLNIMLLLSRVETQSAKNIQRSASRSGNLQNSSQTNSLIHRRFLPPVGSARYPERSFLQRVIQGTLMYRLVLGCTRKRRRTSQMIAKIQRWTSLSYNPRASVFRVCFHTQLSNQLTPALLSYLH